jgi:hypothetical protein
MSGKKITRSQVRLYMESKRIKKTQLAAAARAEISVSTAHRIEKGIVTGNPESRVLNDNYRPSVKDRSTSRHSVNNLIIL